MRRRTRLCLPSKNIFTLGLAHSLPLYYDCLLFSFKKISLSKRRGQGPHRNQLLGLFLVGFILLRRCCFFLFHDLFVFDLEQVSEVFFDRCDSVFVAHHVGRFLRYHHLLTVQQLPTKGV